jgi:ankyrin repeat protein
LRYWKSVIVALVAAIVCVVIIAGINTVRRPSADGLQVASIKGDAARVKALLSSNRSLAVERGYRNYTSLHWAAMGGHYQVAKLLLDNGAEANAVSEENVSPLYLAALAGHSELVRLLLSHGADTGLHCHYSGIYHRGSGSGNIYPVARHKVTS